MNEVKGLCPTPVAETKVLPKKVKFKKLHEDAVIPSKAHPTDAGFDLTIVDISNNCENYIEYDTGIAIELPVGYAAFLYPRSSISNTKFMLSNSVGVIDANFRNSIKVRLKAITAVDSKDNIYGVGNKIAQLVIIKLDEFEFEEVDELSDTDRGTGGFGSTGK